MYSILNISNKNLTTVDCNISRVVWINCSTTSKITWQLLPATQLQLLSFRYSFKRFVSMLRKTRFIRRLSVASNAIQTIDN